MSVNDIALPKYTPTMELWNAITHALGVCFVLIASPFLIGKAASSHDGLTCVCAAIYLFSMLLCYLGSTVYHALIPGNQKKIMRVLDHDNVFFLIAGSYLPYCLLGLRNSPWGYAIFGIVVSFSLLGIILNSINIQKYEKFCTAVEIIIASTIVSAFYPLWKTIGPGGVVSLFASGCFYWIGAVLYGVGGRKNPWYHTVFHLFILIATIIMFVSIYLFVI